MTKVILEREREFVPFREHWHAANVLLEISESKIDGWFYPLAASIVFQAFSLEAFLNHVGTKVVQDWMSKWERKPWESKIAVIFGGKQQPDLNLVPWRVCRELKQFRDPIAHGKDAIFSESLILTRKEAEELRRTHLHTPEEKFATLANAKEAIQNLGLVYKQTYKDILLENLDLNFCLAGSGSIKVMP
jgi:hypothetical protein